MRQRRQPPVPVIAALARLGDLLPPRLQVRLSGRPPIVVDGQRLDPGVQLMLATRDRLGDPPPETLSVKEGRAYTAREAAIARGRKVPVGEVRDLTVPGAAGPLPARLYVTDEPGGPHPLLVFFHGGGFVVGDLDTHDAPCRVLCRHAGVHVLSVAYRLAPEHPFPEYVDDALAAFRWAAGQAAALGADPARVAVGGDSAGGNLSAVIAQAAARGELPAPALQLLIYPATDATVTRRSQELFGEGFFLTSAQIEWYTGHFMPADADPADVRRSPLLADDLSGLAPAIVVTAGFDPLRDEGEAYADALRAAGVPTVLRRFESLFHGFLNAGGINRASRAAVLEIAGMTRALLGVQDAHAAGDGEGAGGGEHVAERHRDAA
jgi:acetyl esterase